MKIIFSLIFLASSFAFAALEDGLTFTVSKQAVVVPNDLSDSNMQTCVFGGVNGPRVRIRSTIKWEGPGDFLPMVIHLSFDNSKVAKQYSGVVSPEGSFESLAYFYDLKTDYIPSGTTVYQNSKCFLDFGKLPAPVSELKGNESLDIPVEVAVAGMVRDSFGNEQPIVKVIKSSIVYMAGSVPVP